MAIRTNAPSMRVTRNYDALMARANGKATIHLERCDECQKRLEAALAKPVPAIGIRHGAKTVALTRGAVMEKEHYAKKYAGTVDRSTENMVGLREGRISDYEHIQCPNCKRKPVRYPESAPFEAVTVRVPKGTDREAEIAENRKRRKKEKRNRKRVIAETAAKAEKKPLDKKDFKPYYVIRASVPGIWGFVEGRGKTLADAKASVAAQAGENRFKPSWVWHEV